VDSHKAGVTVQSISVEYARQGAETERNARWQESGLKMFAETVTRIAQSDGLRMKQRTPLINHKNVCDYLTRSGDEIIALLDEVAAGLDDAAQKLHQEYERLCLELEQRLQPKIERLIDRYAMDNRQYLSHCSRVWEEEITTSKAALLTQVQQGFDQLTLNLNQLDMIDEAIPGFEKRVERIAFHSRLGENVGKAGGAAVGTAIGALMGSIVPGIGTAIGATVGGLLGGMFGGYGGGKIGENFNSTEYEDIEVGDNRVEVALRTRNILSKRAERELGAVTVMLENASYGDIKAWLTEIHTALTALQLELRSQHLDLKKELLNNELT
jgi:phage-related tail protein